MKNKKNVIIAVMIAVALLMATGYAYFATRLNINATGNITSTWNVYFESISAGTKVGNASNVVTPSVTGTSANMSVNLELPGDSMTYSLVLKNGGTVPAVIENIVAEAKGSSAIIYTMSGLNIGDKLAGGASKTITIKIEYDNNTTSQPALTSKILTVTIDAVQDIGQSITTETPVIEEKTLAARILKDNIVYADNVSSTYVASETGINFSQISSDTNGKGLYYTTDNTESNHKTYYFRGAVDNNYVKFGKTTYANVCAYNGELVYRDVNEVVTSEATCTANNVCLGGTTGTSGSQYANTYYNVSSEAECTYRYYGTLLSEKATFQESVSFDIFWKIVRINEDGSVRLIYQGISTTDGDARIGGSAFNASANDHAYLGYMYGTVGSLSYVDTHKNTNDSTMKDYLDDWYVGSLKTNYESYLADPGFCNDRTVSSGLGYGNNNGNYGVRVSTSEGTQQPQFSCPQTNDLFTTSSSFKGNKSLIYPVGLITVDEVIYAGGVKNTNNTSYYLNASSPYWTMTPSSFGGADNTSRTAFMYYVTPDGNMSTAAVSAGYYTTITFGVRPVINLKANVEISSGNGTSVNPYVIKTN